MAHDPANRLYGAHNKSSVPERKCAMECVEEKGYRFGLQGLEMKNPYVGARYGFGAGFRNHWRRGYDRGKAERQDAKV